MNTARTSAEVVEIDERPAVDLRAKLDHRPDIDGLRAVAVLAVIAYHAFPERAPGGFVGVDVFFVISGFLISRIILAERSGGGFSFRAFYARRIRRIFPALIVVLAFILGLGYLLLLPDEYQSLGLHVAAGSVFSSNFLLWKEGGYFEAGVHKPLLHLWSLGIEEQFYLLWPAALVALSARRKAFEWVAVIAAVSFAANLLLVTFRPTAAFYSPLTRMWELLLGALLVVPQRDHRCVVEPSVRWMRFRHAASVLGLALIGVSATRFSSQTPFPGIGALAPTVGTALLIAAGPAALINRYVLSVPPAVWLGVVSYSLYLWHWPLLVIADLSFSVSPWVRAAVVVLAVALSVLSYVLVERPCRLAKGRVALPVALTCTVFILACAGAAISASDGIPFRYPPVVQAISSFRFDYETAYRERCSLPLKADPATFAYCVDPAARDDAESLVLWGDSHADHLYPGIVARWGGATRILRFTASSCPPILGHPVPVGFPRCEDFNQHVLDLVRREPPARIIVAAGWKWYRWELLPGTIAQLRRAGAQRIDIVGPVPNWLPTLKRSLINNARFHGAGDVFPQRMAFGLDPRVRPLDESMRTLVSRADANYISSWSIFCADGCLTRVGPSVESLTAWDYGHLTSEGSKYLVSRFPD